VLPCLSVAVSRAAVLLDEDDLSSVADILRFYSPAHISSLRHQVKFFWRTYFSSLRAITLTTLQIINDRVFPYTSLKYEHWNDPPASVSDHGQIMSPNVIVFFDTVSYIIYTSISSCIF